MPEYVLGVNEKERARLQLQQEVWGGVTDRFLDRIGVRGGWRCLDLGCGPGFVIESLRARVGPSGSVDALDQSATWHESLRRTARDKEWTNVRLLDERIEDAMLDEGAYDLVFARWVLSFMPDVGAIVKRLAHALKPGGTLAVQDYNHEGISLFPESEGFKSVVWATRRLYGSRGGDAWVATRLPKHLKDAGLELVDYTPNALAGGPQSGVFRWADAFFPSHSEGMVAAGHMSAKDRERFLSEWEERKRDPTAVFFSPFVVDVAARKPPRRS
jgi:ubiquinone/menaquinone biosynthesis C-methylase UbiE